MKKIWTLFVSILCLVFLSSCGVKGDPVPTKKKPIPSLFDQYPDLKLKDEDKKKAR